MKTIGIFFCAFLIGICAAQLKAIRVQLGAPNPLYELCVKMGYGECHR